MPAGNSWHCDGSPFGSFRVAARSEEAPDDDNILFHTAVPTRRERPVRAFHLFRRRPCGRRRGSPAALVGTADMGPGSRGKGLSNSVPVWNRDHCLLGPAAGEHPGPAVGAQWASGVGQEFPADQYGRHVPAERRGEVRRPGLPVPGRLRPRRIHDGNHQGTHPGTRRFHPGHHRAQGTAAQCRVPWPDLRRRG